MTNTSIYLHIPFCKHRCAYCDFNTYAGQEDSIPDYVNALIREIDFVANQRVKDSANQRSDYSTTRPLDCSTIFFGGGTPSLLSAPQFDSILRALRSAFALSADAEISIEANPGTISPEKLNAIRKSGINRISFGVQSANTEELRMLERIHDFFTVIESVSAARKAGFDNLNLDLIYGLPEQTLESWKTTLSRIIDLHPEHISAYALTLEHGTPFGRWSAKGLLPLPDPDLAADMYEWAGEYLEENGYVQYEISNWAKRVKSQKSKVESSNLQPSTFDFQPEFACKHNLQYWRGLPYLGLGAGAHGYANGVRYSNVLRIKTYIERLANYQLPITNYQFPLTPATVNQHLQTREDDMGEFMMTGLRLTREGISSTEFESRFGESLNNVYGKDVEELTRLGLLEWQAERLRLTRRGRLLGNQVFMRFVG
jgi:oxygen-independent coproporphyrinogen-3 oxidase